MNASCRRGFINLFLLATSSSSAWLQANPYRASLPAVSRNTLQSTTRNSFIADTAKRRCFKNETVAVAKSPPFHPKQQRRQPGKPFYRQENRVTPRQSQFNSHTPRRNQSSVSQKSAAKSFQRPRHPSRKNITTAKVKSPTIVYNTTKGAIKFNRELNLLVKQQSFNRSQSTQSVAQRATDLLLERVHFNSTDYDTVSYNIVLSAWSRERTPSAARKADQLLSLLLSNPRKLQADSYSYGSVLHAYAKSGDGVRAATRATELLHQLESSPHVTLATDFCHNSVMDSWAMSGHREAGMRAESILRRLMDDSSPIQPTRVSFNACINAYARSGQMERAQELLMEMKKLAEGGRVGLEPDKISYTTCIDAYAKGEGSLHNAQQAEALLTELEHMYMVTNSSSLRPDVVAYTSVLTAYGKSGSVKSQVATDLLQRLERFASDRPNAVFLNAWINLLAKNMGIEDKQESWAAAEGLLQYMRVAYNERGQSHLKPCKITYTAMITVLAEVELIEAAERADELYEELLSFWRETNDFDYLPTKKTYASLLNAWARCGGTKAWRRAEEIMMDLKHLFAETRSKDLQPNKIIFVQLFQILAKCGPPNAAQTAKDLLREMHDLYRAGCPDVRPDATTYAYLINTFTKAKVENVAELATLVLNEAEAGYRAGIGELRPTAMLYSACLQAYAKCSSREGTLLAEKLLQHTKTLFERGKVYAKPCTMFYNAVMDAHARSHGGRQAAERAMELLGEMESRSQAGDKSLQPNTRSFNAAILAWKNSYESDAPEHAESLLKRMTERYESGEKQVRPDRVTINSIIGVWARSRKENAAEQAENYLAYMEAEYANGDLRMKPDSWSFNTCIDAYSRSKESYASQRALDLYRRMKNAFEAGDIELRPDLITLNSLQTVMMRSGDTKTKSMLTQVADDIARMYTQSVASP